MTLKTLIWQPSSHTLANSSAAQSHQDMGLFPEHGKVIKVALGLNWFTASHVEETVEELWDEILTNATMHHKTLTHISICNTDQSCRKHTTVLASFKEDTVPSTDLDVQVWNLRHKSVSKGWASTAKNVISFYINKTLLHKR